MGTGERQSTISQSVKDEQAFYLSARKQIIESNQYGTCNLDFGEYLAIQYSRVLGEHFLSRFMIVLFCLPLLSIFIYCVATS